MKRQGGTTGPARPSRRGLGYGVLFVAFCFLTGVFLVSPAGQQTWAPLATYFWPATPCQVLAASARITEQWEDPYTLVVKYRYLVPPGAAGQAFEAEQVALDYRGGTDYADVQRLLLRFPAGAPATCYVNPWNPQEAVLLRRVPWSGLLVFLALNIAVIGGVWLVKRMSAKLEEMKSPDGQPLSELAKQPLEMRAEVSRALRWLVGMSCGAAGLAGLVWLCGSYMPEIMQTVAARSWPQVPCKIIHSRLLKLHNGDDVLPRVDIFYEYRVGEQVLRGNTYHPWGMPLDSRRAKQAALARYPAGSERTCRVNPRDPIQTTLTCDFNWGFLLALLALVLVATCAYGVRLFLRPDVFGPATCAAGSEGRQGARASAGATSAAPPAGPLVPRPRTALFVAFIFFAGLAALFSGIAVVAAWKFIQSFRQGQPAWSLAILIGIFGLLDLPCLLVTLDILRAVFAPRPELRLASGRVRLGQTVTVQWRFPGNSSRLRQLRITVVAREEVTCGDGRNAHTDKEVLLELPLVDIRAPQMMQEGQFELTVPADSMHSVVGWHNKIVWLFRVHAAIPRRPDIEEELEFTVLPQEPGLAPQDQERRNCPSPSPPGT